MPSYSEAGRALRDWRTDQKMTQEELAGYCGVTQPTVSYWESGVQAPTLRSLRLIETLGGPRMQTWAKEAS